MAADDFSSLRAHWNFDEGRDWHNMSFPYEVNEDTAAELVGGNNLDLLPGGKKGKGIPNECWVSGRQYSGITGCAEMKARRALPVTLTSTLSLWMRCDKKAKVPAVLASTESGGAQWFAVDKAGKVGFRVGGKDVVKSPEAIHDNEWHHVVISRDASSGQVVLYVDGKEVAKAKGPVGELPGEYDTFSCKDCALDQIHLFDTAVSAETVAILMDNHAPKLYPRQWTVTPNKPTPTGSVLHDNTFDPERNELRVHVPGKEKATWKSNGDGTYTAVMKTKKRTGMRASATITDGRGGFSRAGVRLISPAQTAVPELKDFVYAAELPTFPETGTKAGKHRNPIAVYLGGDEPDLVVQANGRLWLCRNKSSKGKLAFAEPVEIKTEDGSTLETDGAALLRDDILLIRRSDGSMVQGTLSAKKGEATVELGDAVKDTAGETFNCPVRHFVVVDYDHDDVADLVVAFNDGIYYYKGQKAKGKRKKGAESFTFEPEAQGVFHRQYNIAPGIGDLNADGRTDLLYGINWGTLHAWLSEADKPNICRGKAFGLSVTETPTEHLVRDMNGAHPLVADFDGDDVPDIILGDNKNGKLVGALGVDFKSYAKNLDIIEKEFYMGNETRVGKLLEADNQAGLKRYKRLMSDWIRWALSTRTPAARQAAFNMLSKHVKKYPFLQRGTLKEAWIKKDKKTGETTYGDMHHVPGIFTMNWIVLHRLLPDSAAHRKNVADILGLKGADRECYLVTGLPLADNARCSEGQLRAIQDMITYHPREMFPDDHLSIGVMFGDGRDAMSYIFKSNKNTFSDEVGSCIAEMHRDMVELTEKCFGAKGAAGGDYFTFVMAHEVCHSLDAYVRSRANKDLNRRWGDMMVYAANNGGKSDLVVANESGWWDVKLTQERFRERGLWDGDKATWNDTWKKHWEKCEFRNKVFMRGNVDWFLGAQQETLATQANHHWARSESRLIGAILRYLQGYKSNINEVVLYLDIVSGGLNKIPMYHPVGEKNPPRVRFDVDWAWLERNDKGYITDVRIGDRHYSFEVNDTGRVVGVRSYPFADLIQEAAKKKP